MAIGTGAAIIGSSVLSTAGAALGAGAQSDGTKDAALAEYARLQALRPYRKAGENALADFQAGLNVDYDSLAKGVEDDPFYRFQRSEGIKGIEGSAAANGLLRSGRTLKDLTSFGQGLASNSINAAYGRNIDKQNQLMQLIQTGAGAAGAQSNLANIAMQGGQNQADKFTNFANIGTNALQNLMLAKQLQGGAPAGDPYNMAGYR